MIPLPIFLFTTIFTFGKRSKNIVQEVKTEKRPNRFLENIRKADEKWASKNKGVC